MSQDKRTDLVTTDSPSQDEPLKSAPKPNQSNYSEDLREKLIGLALAIPGPELEMLMDIFESERSRLIDELEAKLPEKQEWQGGPIDEKYFNEGLNRAIDLVKATLKDLNK